MSAYRFTRTHGLQKGAGRLLHVQEVDLSICRSSTSNHPPTKLPGDLRYSTPPAARRSFLASARLTKAAASREVQLLVDYLARLRSGNHTRKIAVFPTLKRPLPFLRNPLRLASFLV
jgi:hypothetical protein